MWMSREEIAAALGIVPNSVRGKVAKGQIERKMEDGKNYYRVVDLSLLKEPLPVREDSPAEVPQPEARPQTAPRVQPKSEPQTAPEPTKAPPVPAKKASPDRPAAFNPRQILMDQLASINVGRSIDAIEKGDEIDLATGETSRELQARISMRKDKQAKEIVEALERLKSGEYGMCEECAEPIPEQRLRLFPAARLCVRCQEEYDHYEKMKEDQSVRGGAWREDSSEGGYARSYED